MIVVPTEKSLDWKHTPIILFLIVFLNIVVFFAYQSTDGEKFEAALTTYSADAYFPLEWALYQQQLDLNQPQNTGALKSRIDEISSILELGDIYQASLLLLMDQQFHAQLKEKYENTNFITPQIIELSLAQSANRTEQSEAKLKKALLTSTVQSTYSDRTQLDFEEYEKLESALALTNTWLQDRERAFQLVNATSSIKWGLTPSNITIISLFSYQFMHGDIMHLIGNLVFLILCGFAVEAAIGQLRFILFYLLSGVGGGLLHALVQPESVVPLVGASGAISGVMAMYLALFRWKKIEFFYWLFVFVGYFRAPALFILPFYVGLELWQFYDSDNSSIAFMAHTGGFLVGAILITANQIIFPATINTQYIENDQENPEEQLSLSEIYSSIERFQFEHAVTLIKQHISNFGNNLELLLLAFKLSTTFNRKQAAQLALQALKSHPIDHSLLEKITDIIQTYPKLKAHLDLPSLARLGINYLRETPDSTHLKIAESLFSEAMERHKKSPSTNSPLPMFAKKLSQSFGELSLTQKSEHYRHTAVDLAKADRGE